MGRQKEGMFRVISLVFAVLLVSFLTLQGSKAQIRTGEEIMSAAAANTCTVTFDGNGGTPSKNSKTVTVGGTYGDLPTATRSGYKFLGWYTSKGDAGRPVTSSTKVEAYMNHSIYAHWAKLTCTVSLNLNGGHGTSQYFGSFSREYGSKYGSNLDRDPSPPGAGQHFVGWYTSASGGSKVTSSSTVPSKSSITLYAHYDNNKYTVKFNANGGSGSMGNKTYTYGTSYKLPSYSFSKTGYSFAGWATSSGGSVKYSNGESVKNLTSTNNGTVTLYAKWNRAKCNISMNLNGGSGSDQYFGSFSRYQGDTLGDPLTRDPAPPTGKHFVGWYDAASGGTKYTESSKAPYKSSFTLYAQYEYNSYTVKFSANGGSGSMADKTYKYETAYNLPSNAFTKTGYTFAGWSTSANGSVVYTNGQSVKNLTSLKNGTVTLYAQWKEIICTVTLNLNGGSGSSQYFGNFTRKAGAAMGDPLTRDPAPPTGKHFVGWYDATSGGTKYTNTSKAPNKTSLTLYARYEFNTYTVKFNANNGSGSMGDKTYTYGTAYNLPSNSFSRNGYGFIGWSTSANGSVVYTNGESVKNLTSVKNGTVTLYAQWKEIICTVSLNLNGGNGTAQYFGNFTRKPGAVMGDPLTRDPAPPAGKHFVGWYDAASGGNRYTSTSKAPNKTSLTLYAQYEINAYKVKFNANGGSGSMTDRTYNYGTEYNLPKNAFTRKGYTFVGWSTTADGSVSYSDSQSVKNLAATNGATVNLYAKWKILTCTITLNLNGGSGSDQYFGKFTRNQGSTIGEPLTRDPAPPAGMHFVGWYDAQSGGNKYTNTSKAPYQASLTLYAHYDANTYTVKFNSNNGSGVMDERAYKYGVTYALPKNSFTKNGCTFAGWSMTPTGSVKYSDEQKVSNLTSVKNGTVTLYAQWTALTCTITLNLNGGSGSDQYFGKFTRNQGSALGDPLTRDPAPPVGKHFVGWYDATSGGNKYTNTSKAPYKSALTLYARYENNSYKVKFNANGGKGSMDDKTYKYGTTYKLPNYAFTNDGYSFAGWSTTPGGNVKYTDGQSVSNLTSLNGSEVTLYAQWKMLTCTVTLNLNGGSGSDQYFGKFERKQGSTMGEPLTRDPAPPTGKHFIGWYDAATGGNKYTNTSKVPYKSSLTLYAHYEVNSYKVKFSANGGKGSMDEKTYKYGAEYTLPGNTFSKDGYVFAGWSISEKGSVTYTDKQKVKNLTSVKNGTVTLYAQWKEVTCSVTLNLNGGSGTAQYFGPFKRKAGSAMGEPLTRDPAPPVGMHFIGWFDKASGGKQYTSTSKAPNQTSLTLYAHYDFNNYKVKFNANGGTGSMTEKTYRYGSEYALPGNAFTRDGYVFTGWSISEKGSVTYTDKQKVKNLTSIKNGTVTLYAQWKEVTCSVTLNLNGGNGTAQFFGPFTRRGGSVMGEPLTRDPAPPVGMHFIGWFDKASGGKQYTSTSKAPNQTSLTLYAHYDFNSYKVKFNANGGTGTMTEKTYYYGTEYNLPGNAFKKDGYIFTGWSISEKGSVLYTDKQKVKNLASLNGSTVTLYAQWKEQICKISLNLNGGNGTAQFFGSFDRRVGSVMGEPLKRDPAPPIGMHFVGWYDALKGGTRYTDTSKVPNRETFTLYAHYEYNSYTVRFDANGGKGVMSDKTYDYETEYYLPLNAFEKDGYDFIGWGYGTKGSVSYKDGEKVKNLGSLNGSTVTLYALWKEQICTVTLNLNGGNGTAQFFGPFDRKWGSTMGEPLKRDPAPPLGKCFVGWYDAPTGGTKYTEESKAPDKYSLTLYAHYSKADYTVSFNSRGANGKQYLDAYTITVKYGEPYGKLPDDLTHPNGMRFAGWETAGGELVDEKTPVAIAANHTLYARWENPTSYTIIFDGNGNVKGSMDSIVCEYDKEVKLPKVTFDSAEGFDYWSTKPDGTGDVYLNRADVYNLASRTQKEVVLYAIWREGFTVNYHDGLSRKVIKTETKVSHKYVCDYKGPAIEGLTFAGWITLDYADYLVGAPSVDLEYGKPYVVSKDVDFYPVYKPVTKSNAVEVIYFMNGAKGNTYVEYQYAEPGKDMVLVKPNQMKPERADGRPFGGWSIYKVDWHDLFGPGEPIKSYAVGSVVTLYAQWEDYDCELVFDYNYPGGKTVTYSGGQNDSYYSPKPMRKGYELLGWSKVRDGEVVYAKGAAVPVPYGGLTLYAVWQKDVHKVEYYDGITRKYLFTEYLGLEDKVSNNYDQKVVGTKPVGWVISADSNQRVFTPDTEMSVLYDYLPLADYKLYSSYAFNDGQKGKFPVYYHLRGGVGGPTTLSYGDAATGSVVISTIEPTREYGKFIGWSRFPNNIPSYQAGQQIDCSNRDSDYVILYACWESNYTITINSNTTDPKCTKNQVVIKDLFPGELLDMSKYKNTFRRDYEYLLIGWSQNTKYLGYAKEEIILVPAANLTLYAIWHEREYSISYYDGKTNKKLWEDQLVTKDAQITDRIPEKPDQKFRGWRYGYTEPQIIDFVPGQKFIAEKNIVLYSVYEESDEGIPDGFYAVVFDSTLGSGGPGRVLYSVKEADPKAPSEIPTSKEYEFEGWCYEGDTSNAVNFYPGESLPIKVKEGHSRIVHAVWHSKNVNPIGEKLRDNYGRTSEAMKSYHFDDTYISNAWEQINPFAWCVIKTERAKGSKLKCNMKTTAAVIEYKLNGEWVLDVYGNEWREGIWNALKYRIFCSNTNAGGTILNFLVNASKTAASIAVPQVGIVLTAVDVLDGVMKIIGSRPEEYKETRKLIAETAGIPIDAIGQSHVEDFLNKAFKEGANSGTKFVAAAEICRSAVEFIADTAKASSYKDDPFGNYDVAIGTFKERMSDTALKSFASGVSEVIRKIYKNVNYRDLLK